MFMDREAIENLDRELWEKGELTFETRGELLTSAAAVVAFQYLKYLEECRDKADKNSLDFKYFNARIYKDIEPYEKALKNVLTTESEKKVFGRKRIKITCNSKFVKIALKAIGVKNESGIFLNITYVIDLKENKLRWCVR